MVQWKCPFFMELSPLNLIYNDCPVWVILPQARSSEGPKKDFEQIQKYELYSRA